MSLIAVDSLLSNGSFVWVVRQKDPQLGYDAYGLDILCTTLDVPLSFGQRMDGTMEGSYH